MDLGDASGFAVLGGSGITVAGGVASTEITGDIGTFPTVAITGLEKVVLTGNNHGADALTESAKTDLVAAYIDAAGRAYNVQYTGGYDLGGQSLSSGVYNSASSLFLTGTLTLDAQGNSDAVWIFQAGSTLITASSSLVNLVGGAQASNVFWQVGSSATLGTYSNFAGNILALTSITVTTGVSVDGRVLARNGAVTLDQNTIDVPSAAPQRISGTQTIAGDLTVTGTLAPGTGTGVLTVTGTTTLTSGSVFEWNLDTARSNPESNRGAAYGGINTDVLDGSGSVFKIMLTGDQDFSDTFWNGSHTWNDIFKDGDDTTVLGDWASIFGGGIQYSYNGQSAAPTSQGGFTITGNSLTWSAVPESSSALVGLMLVAALCRRQRIFKAGPCSQASVRARFR